MNTVSVIMPTYNCLMTLPKALDSLQNQTHTDLEILIVDDHSTDGTWEWLQQIAPKDARIKLFRTIENSGSSTARQIALDHANGAWMTLCDGDDWYEYDRVEQLLKVAREFKADLVIDNLKIFDHSQNKIVDKTNFGLRHNVLPFTAEHLFRSDNPLNRDSAGYAQPLIRINFIREHNVSYWKKYRNNEDFIFLAELLLENAKAFALSEAYYVYRHRISPTTKRVSPTSHSQHNTALSIAHACDELIRKYEKVMSKRTRQNLLRRKRIFVTSSIAMEQTNLFTQRLYGNALMLFMKHPALLGYRAVGAHKRLLRNLQHTLFSLEEDDDDVFLNSNTESSSSRRHRL